MAKVHRLSVYRPKRSVRATKNPLEACYDDSDNYESYLLNNDDLSAPVVPLIPTNHNCSRNVVDYLQRREHGAHVVRPISLKREYGTRHLIQHNLLRERQVSLNSYNKVFCAKWLSDTQVVLGTKCNKLLVLDLVTKKFIKIPCLNSSQPRATDHCNGIYSIQMNPSQTLLATGARNANNVAVYQLPTLEPVCIGEDAHNDRIFDIEWLDDQYFVSGSRDTKIALWKVDENVISVNRQKLVPSHASMTPLVSKVCSKAEKVRALSFNPTRQTSSHKLPHCLENVSLVLRSDCSLYAVGSKSNVTLHDSRTLSTIQRINTRTPGASVRSLSFDNATLTMGLGTGMLMFYDCRAGKYLENKLNPKWSRLDGKTGDIIKPATDIPVVFRASKGWVYPDELYRQIFQADYNTAILTHCYDRAGTKLFAAGGPLPSGLFGNYAGLWQ